MLFENWDHVSDAHLGGASDLYRLSDISFIQPSPFDFLGIGSDRSLASLALDEVFAVSLASIGSYHGAITKPSPYTVSADDDPIVVTGAKVYHYASPLIFSSGGGGGWTLSGDGGSGGDGSGTGTETAPPPDEASIDITINISRPLTASEQTAIAHLKETIEQITAAIHALADNAIVRMPNGADVTGAELKAIWAKTDFVIYDNEPFGNQSYRGEAKMINGDPQISFNIGGDGLDAYDNFVGGMNYLVAHELGHLTQWGTPLVYSEVTANDIARALLNGAGLEYLANPGFGYTDTAPTQFSVSPPSGGGDGGGSGGGEGGGGGWGEWEYDQPL